MAIICWIPMYFVCFCPLARGYTTGESGYIRGKLFEIHRDGYYLLNSDVFCLFLPACAGIHYEGKRVYSRDIFWIHRDWMKTRNSDVFCLFLPACAGIHCEEKQVYSREIIWIHRDWMKTRNSDVFCFGNFWRYIGNSLDWPIPMYFIYRFGPPYIGMGIEISIPMYRLPKLE